MLNMLIYRKFEFVQLSPDKVKGREVKEEFS